MTKDFEELQLPLIFDERKGKPRKKSVVSDNARTVLKARYLKKNLKGEVVETCDQMFHRVAQTVSCAELKYGGKNQVAQYEELFYNAMASLDFLPNSPTLMNAGLSEGQLSACFVIPVGDSMPEIFEAVKQAALIQKSGGGVGYSFSRLRPAGDRVKTTSGVSSGPISFMKVFNEATETVKQGGRRRGANMGVLRVDHPDILDFINAKQTEGVFSNFNISVGITDAFMKAVRENTDYDLINPRSGKPEESIPAARVWNNIVDNAWIGGDPGLLFLDRINKDNPTPKIGSIESTNPCGEACLLPFEACNLGSVNLSRFVSNGGIDFARLRDTIHLAIRFLDDVIDVNDYVPLIPQIRQQTLGNRKMGLGVMGFADLLIDLGIPYGEPRAVKLADTVMSFVQREAKEASKLLARERGCFRNWERSTYFPDTPIRNACVTSIAPTGTLSIISGCSPGIEPLFGVAFHRNVLDGTKLLEVNPRFARIAKEQGFYSQDLMDRVARTGTIQEFDEIPETVRKLFVTALDVPPEKHVLMQAAFQAHTDMSVSKTINLPNLATRDHVEKVFLKSFETGCKGITVFRYGCLSRQVITIGNDTKANGGNGQQKTDGEIEFIDIPTITAGEVPCPECGEGTIILGACSVCQHCGYSKCG